MTKSAVRDLIVELVKAVTDEMNPAPHAIPPDLTVHEQVDSLALVSIVAELEDRLGVHIENGELEPEHLRSVETLADFVFGKL